MVLVITMRPPQANQTITDEEIDQAINALKYGLQGHENQRVQELVTALHMLTEEAISYLGEIYDINPQIRH